MNGNSEFFWVQVGGLAIACVWAFGFTYMMLAAIDTITPVRVSEDDQSGVDEALHGESAYTD